MRALAVDDERMIVKALAKVVGSSPDITNVNAFMSGREALEYAAQNPVDIAFLDIHMRDMNGIELAKKILEIKPECKIIFCTNYEGHALEAYRIHASGYLIKPITAEAVQREIDYIKNRKANKKLLTVRCFGQFEVYANGKPMTFLRSRAKEVLAYLIDRKGAGVSVSQICTVLWENDLNDKKNKSYLRTLVVELQRALHKVGAEQVIIKHGVEYSVDLDKIDCDYVTYCQSGMPRFTGEYMNQYSWAEVTCARLKQNQN